MLLLKSFPKITYSYSLTKLEDAEIGTITKICYNIGILSEENWKETTLNIQRQGTILVVMTHFVTHVDAWRPFEKKTR